MHLNCRVLVVEEGEGGALGTDFVFTVCIASSMTPLSCVDIVMGFQSDC